MTGKQRALAAAVGIHLAIAALYATHIPTEIYLPAAIDRPLALYGRFSGAHTHFDFFAPSVATQARARFTIVAADGSGTEVALASPSGEVNNRIAMMLTFYGYPHQREVILRSLGEYMLRQHPHAVAVDTRVEVLEIPPLHGTGETRATWAEVGRARLRREDASRG
jgi:hypothetical protein